MNDDIITRFIKEVQKNAKSIYLPQVVKRIYLTGYEEGCKETLAHDQDYDDGYRKGTADTERRIATELRHDN